MLSWTKQSAQIFDKNIVARKTGHLSSHRGEHVMQIGINRKPRFGSVIYYAFMSHNNSTKTSTKEHNKDKETSSDSTTSTNTTGNSTTTTLTIRQRQTLLKTRLEVRTPTTSRLGGWVTQILQTMESFSRFPIEPIKRLPISCFRSWQQRRWFRITI